MAGSIKNLLRCVEAFRAIKSEMPSQHIALFLLVALHEGITLAELAENLNTTSVSCGRNAKLLSKYVGRDGAIEGYDLISVLPTKGDRRLACFLTPKGQKLVAKLEETLK